MAKKTEQSGDLARQLRAAADQAVMNVPGATPLGDGDFARLFSRVSDPSMNPQDRLRLMESFATEIAVANRDQPRNLFDARPDTTGTGAKANYWALPGSQPNRTSVGGGSDGANSGDTPVTSSSYARNFPADAAFLRTVGLSEATGKALASMGITSQEQIREIVKDVGSLGIDKNKGSVALGMMKSDDPTNYNSHVHFFGHDYKQGLENIAGLDGKIAQEKDPAKKAQLTRQRDELTAQLEKARQHEREKSKGHQKALQGFDATSGLIQNNIGLKRRLGATQARELSSAQTLPGISQGELAAVKAVKQAAKPALESTTLAELDDLAGDGPKAQATAPVADAKPQPLQAKDKKDAAKPVPEKPKPAYRIATTAKAGPSVG